MAFVWGSIFVFIGVILMLIDTKGQLNNLSFLQRMSLFIIIIGLFLPYVISFINQILY